MNDARGDTALAQLYRARARVIACVIDHAISFRRRRRHRHRTPWPCVRKSKQASERRRVREKGRDRNE